MLLGKRGKKKMGMREERERKKRERGLKSSLEWRYYENGWSARAIVEEGGKNPVDTRL